jgi:hypothetical protein
VPEFFTPSQRDADNWPGAAGVVLTNPGAYPVLLDCDVVAQTVEKSADFAFQGTHSWKVHSTNLGPSVLTMTGAWNAQEPRRTPGGFSGDFCARPDESYTYHHRMLWSGSDTVQVQVTVQTRSDFVTPGYVELLAHFDEDIGPGEGWFAIDLGIGPCSVGTAAVDVFWIARTRPTAGLSYTGAVYFDDGSLQGPNSCPGDTRECPPRQPAAAGRTALRLRAHP